MSAICQYILIYCTFPYWVRSPSPCPLPVGRGRKGGCAPHPGGAWGSTGSAASLHLKSKRAFNNESPLVSHSIPSISSKPHSPYS